MGREHTLRVRVSDEELAVIDKLAKDAGKDRSKVVRWLIGTAIAEGMEDVLIVSDNTHEVRVRRISLGESLADERRPEPLDRS